jgi:deoxyribodipyrimidine photolyase-related protein
LSVRHLVVVLGDQLDCASAAFDGFDPSSDAVLQMEVREEATYIPQHKLRLAFFFAAMRHFRDAQRTAGRRVFYSELDDPLNRGSFSGEIVRHADAVRPERLVVLEPGDYRVREELEATARSIGVALDIRPDPHFLCPADTFEEFADRSSLLLERFYRFMRRRLGILLDETGEPLGGKWNFDSENRKPLDKAAPPIPRSPRFAPDKTTREVLALVAREFPDSPGRLDEFAFPVTREQAIEQLDNFVAYRLEHFGPYQDAMRTGEPVLFHSRLSGPPQSARSNLTPSNKPK